MIEYHNTYRQRLATEIGCRPAQLGIYRHRLKKRYFPWVAKYSGTRIYFFAMYVWDYSDGINKPKLQINGTWEVDFFHSPQDVINFANKVLMPRIEPLDDYWAQKLKVPNTAIKLLRIHVK